MNIHPSGEVMLVNLPGTGSLLQRSWTVYKVLFHKLIALTALFGIGAFLTITIQDALSVLVQNGSAFQQGAVKIINLLLNIAITGFYFSYIFAGMVHLIHHWKDGERLTLTDAFKAANDHYIQLFIVGALLFFVMNGGLVFPIMPFFFSIWFYFALYAVILGRERGVEALAKSRYLVHGIFFRVVGRYAAILLLMFALFSLLWLLLLVPVIGWALFSIAFIVTILLVFPFFIVYEYFRYIDVTSVRRSEQFHFYSGERMAIVAWALIGVLLACVAWSYDIIGKEGRAAFTDSVIVRFADVVLPVSNEWNRNVERASEILQNIKIISPKASKNLQ